MKMNKESRELFASQIAKASAKGLIHFAKPAGLACIRFAASEAEAIRLATNAARKSMRESKTNGQLPSIQSGEI